MRLPFFQTFDLIFYFSLYMQELEYVEGYEGLEEEDDMEDYGGPAIKDIGNDDDDGNGNTCCQFLYSEKL